MAEEHRPESTEAFKIALKQLDEDYARSKGKIFGGLSRYYDDNGFDQETRPLYKEWMQYLDSISDVQLYNAAQNGFTSGYVEKDQIKKNPFGKDRL